MMLNLSCRTVGAVLALVAVSMPTFAQSPTAAKMDTFLADVIVGTPPVQVTDAGYDAQHAKFFPSGDRLILTSQQVSGIESPRGIVWIDISQYIR